MAEHESPTVRSVLPHAELSMPTANDATPSGKRSSTCATPMLPRIDTCFFVHCRKQKRPITGAACGHQPLRRIESVAQDGGSSGRKGHTPGHTSPVGARAFSTPVTRGARSAERTFWSADARAVMCYSTAASTDDDSARRHTSGPATSKQTWEDARGSESQSTAVVVVSADLGCSRICCPCMHWLQVGPAVPQQAMPNFLSGKWLPAWARF